MFDYIDIINFFAIKIVAKDFNEIVHEKELLNELRRLTLTPSSGMNYELDRIIHFSKERPVKAQALLAYRHKELVAWAILSEEPSNYFYNNGGFNPEDGVLFEVYVQPSHRREGIGSQLINKAKNLVGDKKLCVCPWDGNSHCFFSKFTHFNYKTI